MRQRLRRSEIERLLGSIEYRTTPRGGALLSPRAAGGQRAVIASLVEAGRLVLVAGRMPRPRFTSARPDGRAAPPVLAAHAETGTSWIRLQVVHHTTGEPFAGVRLTVRTPSGAQRRYETRRDGMVAVLDIPPGVCDVTSAVERPRLRRTLGFVGLGPVTRTSADAPAPERRGPRRRPDEPLTGWDWLARVEQRKVRRGDTLERIAAEAGMTAVELAEFNWSTRDPQRINAALYDVVGCTRTSPDGLNAEFSDDDVPGVIHVPKLWRAEGLPTEQTHVLRVRIAEGFRLVLENQNGLRIPEAEYEARFSDGSVHEGRLGRAGVAWFPDPPPGPVEVRYPDPDDVEAKSLAACARRAMDDRDLDEVFRVLKHSRWMIRRTIEMYDRYYNDYTGDGLLGDIDHEATDADDRDAIEALLRIAELHAEPSADAARGAAEEAQT